MERNTPFVSIVVPTRNRAGLLRDCLATLIAQDYPPDRYEIIVVDDDSEDNTAEVVRTLRTRSNGPSLSSCRRDRGGINRARNAGISRARGDIVALFDDDEMIPKGVIKDAVRYLSGTVWADALGGWVRPKHEPPMPFMCRRCSEVFKGIQYRGGDKEIVEVAEIPGGCLFAWRRAFDEYGLFDEQLSGPGDDSEWCVRARRLGAKFAMARDVWIWHRVQLRHARIRDLWRQFGSVSHYVRARRAMSWDGCPAQDVALAIRSIRHGVFRRCPFGYAHAVWRFAVAWQWMYARKKHSTGRATLHVECTGAELDT